MTVALDHTAIMSQNKATLDLTNIKIPKTHPTIDLGTSASDKLVVKGDYCKWQKPIIDFSSDDLIPCNATTLSVMVLKKILKTVEVFDKDLRFTLHCFSNTKDHPTNQAILVRYSKQPSVFSLVMPILEDNPDKAELPFMITPVA